MWRKGLASPAIQLEHAPRGSELTRMMDEGKQALLQRRVGAGSTLWDLFINIRRERICLELHHSFIGGITAL